VNDRAVPTPRTDLHGLPSPDGRFLWDARDGHWEPRESWTEIEVEVAAGSGGLDVERLAQAFHMSQRCVHGVGSGKPMQTPGYLAPDREWANDIAAEYARLQAAGSEEET